MSNQATARQPEGKSDRRPEANGPTEGTHDRTRGRYAEVLAEGREMVFQVHAWMLHELAQRVENRSHGKMTCTLLWEDGRLTLVDVSGSHTLRPGRRGVAASETKLPGAVDTNAPGA